ncbi:MAG: hypothetical protein QG653_628, partial [Patescibacteria group bacterium]|nr:hypothetical protein [Patescibacteria group bacterium]
TNIVERLEKVGVFCPLLSRETYAGTLGGLVAENAFTCASITHGDTRLWVEGIRIVLDDGKEYTIEEGVPPTGRLLEIYTNLSNYLEHESGNIHASVNKMIDSTSGYNIWNRAVGQRQLIDLLVGSEGTLGIVTAITLRVVPLIKHSYTLSCGVNTIADIHHAKKIYRNFDVDSLSLFDTSMLALSSLDDQKKLPAHIKKNNTRYILSGLFIRKQDEVAHHMVKSCGNKLIPLSKEIFVETGTSWVEEEHLFVKKTLHRHLARVGDFACITTLDSIATKEDANEKLTDELSQLITSYGYTQIFGTQASLTHVSLLFFADTITRQGRQHLEGFLKEASHIIMMYKGSITGGNGDGLVRTPYMETSSDAHMRNVFLYIQRLFDPEQIFNSGKKTFVTTTAIEHYLHNKASN